MSQTKKDGIFQIEDGGRWARKWPDKVGRKDWYFGWRLFLVIIQWRKSLLVLLWITWRYSKRAGIGGKWRKSRSLPEKERRRLSTAKTPRWSSALPCSHATRRDSSWITHHAWLIMLTCDRMWLRHSLAPFTSYHARTTLTLDILSVDTLLQTTNVNKILLVNWQWITKTKMWQCQTCIFANS